MFNVEALSCAHVNSKLVVACEDREERHDLSSYSIRLACYDCKEAIMSEADGLDEMTDLAMKISKSSKAVIQEYAQVFLARQEVTTAVLLHGDGLGKNERERVRDLLDRFYSMNMKLALAASTLAETWNAFASSREEAKEKVKEHYSRREWDGEIGSYLRYHVKDFARQSLMELSLFEETDDLALSMVARIYAHLALPIPLTMTTETAASKLEGVIYTEEEK